jgi:non-ribosomal peptide synthetase component F
VTPFCLYYVAWAALLSRRESENELVFLTTHSLRSPENPEFQNTLGLLLNTLPLKAWQFPEKDTATRCREMMEAFAQAREHANYPLFEIFSDAPQTLKDFTERCALLNIENYPKLQGECFGNLSIERFESIELPHHPLTLNILLDEQASNVTLQLLYETSMYTENDAETLLERYREEMKQILSDSESPHQPA